MNEIYFTMRSITRGQKGRDVLRRAGLRCSLLRAPGTLGERGCAYALTLERRDARRAAALLEENGLRPEGIYFRGPDGSFGRADR